MKKISKYFAGVLSFVLLFNLFGLTAASAQSTQAEESNVIISDYEEKLDEAFDSYYNEKNSQLGIQSVQPTWIGPVIGHILKFTMQQLKGRAAAVAVQTTTRNIATRLTAHAIVEAAKDGITTLMIDNLLEGKSSGMRSIEKYYDIETGARIVYDPNNKNLAILDRSENIVFTIYNDTGKNTIDNRVNNKKRWFKSMWNFK